MEEFTLMAAAEPQKSLPKLEADMKLIQDLPEKPRTSNGWPVGKFMQEFDKGILTIQDYLNNVLLPALIAKNLPFVPTTGIPETDIQKAIENVQQQVVESTAGSIPNNSIGSEKLTQALYNRVFGGLAWLSFDEPTAEDNLSKNFPIGQKWIRPEWTMTNADTAAWSVTGGTAEAAPGHVTITGNKSQPTVVATETFSGIGQEGDQVIVTLHISGSDPEISEMRVTVDGVSTVVTTNYSKTVSVSGSGAVIVSIAADYPTLSVADGSVVVDKITVLNISKLQRENVGVRAPSSWLAFLDKYAPFGTVDFGYHEYTQVKSGKWVRSVFDPIPTEGGGTGISSYSPGQMLYAGEDGKLAALTGENGYLKFDGLPKWTAKEEIPADIGALRVMTGEYVGNGADSRDIKLPVVPVLFHVGTKDANPLAGNGRFNDNPVTLAQHGIKMEINDGYMEFGRALLNRDEFTSEKRLANRSGIRYFWVAIY